MQSIMGQISGSLKACGHKANNLWTTVLCGCLAGAIGQAYHTLGNCDISFDGNEYSFHQSSWKEVDPERGNKVKLRKTLPFLSNSRETLAWTLRRLD